MLMKRVLSSCCRNNLLANKLQSKKVNCLPFSLSSVKYSNFEKDEEQTTSASLFNIKKAIKFSGLEFDEGFTCIRTNCPICDYDGKPAKDKKKTSIYVNKYTGKPHNPCPLYFIV